MATSTRSRSSSFAGADDGTYVNFSRPQRTMSMKSDTSARWREQVEAALDGAGGGRKEENTEEVLPYRPVKANYVQLHVTSGVNNAVASRPSFSNGSRPTSRDAAPITTPTINNPQPQPQPQPQATPNVSRPRSFSVPRQSLEISRPQPNLNASVQSLNITPSPAPSISDERPNRFTRRASLSKKPVKGWPSSVGPPPPSPGGSYRFHDTPKLTRTPWEIERGKPKSRWSRASNSNNTLSARIFRELPREIYQCILDHVENVHLQGALLDVPGSRADLRALCLVDRKWNRVAREYLYRELWLPSNKTVGKRKFLRQPKKSKLKLLQHTLGSAPGTAFLVSNMHITTALAEEIEAEANGSVANASVLETLQDIVQQCYNLESVSGYIPETSIATLPLAKALATRTRLRAHAWNLNSEKTLPGLIAFTNCHDQWKNLDSLVIAGDFNVDLGKVAVSTIISKLPKLKHLMLSGLHNDDFHHGSLLALPALTSLRLEKLAGINEQGIHQLAYSRLAPKLERLTLVGLEVKSLETVQTLLLHLTKLKAFAFVQDVSPELRPGRPAVNSFNLLTSASLEYLHWDCLQLGSAISRFAEAIQGGRFPQLRKVKIPCDFDGTIQTLCRPIPQVKLTQKDMNYVEAHFKDGYERNLLVSQIQAQVRIQKYRRTPSFRFATQEDIHRLSAPHDIGSCAGNPASRIEYDLTPGVDAAALAEFGEIARPRGSAGGRLEKKVDLGVLF